MRLPKRYGQSKLEKCPFCGKTATAENDQGVSTCLEHKQEKLPDMKCACGDYLDIRKGKFGAFFTCMQCGAISMKKALEMNPVPQVESRKVTIKTSGVTFKHTSKTTGKTPADKAPSYRSMTSGPRPDEQVRSDDPRYFD